jgi:large subunit ribosomal protein L2
MSVRKLKPITPGQRFRVVNGYDAITTDKPERSLMIKNSGGRNSQGKMTMRYTVVTSRDIVSLISNVQKKEFLRQ